MEASTSTSTFYHSLYRMAIKSLIEHWSVFSSLSPSACPQQPPLVVSWRALTLYFTSKSVPQMTRKKNLPLIRRPQSQKICLSLVVVVVEHKILIKSIGTRSPVWHQQRINQNNKHSTRLEKKTVNFSTAAEPKVEHERLWWTRTNLIMKCSGWLLCSALLLNHPAATAPAISSDRRRGGGERQNLIINN